MPRRSDQGAKLRQRRATTPATSTPTNHAAPTTRAPSSSTARAFFLSFLSATKPVLHIAGPPLVGIFTALAITDDRFVVPYFFSTLLTLFATFCVTYYRIMQTNDTTRLSFPTVYKVDGTTETPDAMTVLEYDKLQTTYYAMELPMFSIAAVWLYLWTQLRLSFIVYAAFAAFRLIFAPVFRAHLWGAQLSRPFGGAALFEKEDDAKKGVVIVEGFTNFQKLLDDAQPHSLVVVDASATWCGPCKAMAPIFADMAASYSDCTFASFDVDVSQDIAAKLEVTAMPTFFIYKDGEIVHRLQGGNPQNLRNAIEAHMSN